MLERTAGDGHVHSTAEGRYRVEIDGLRCLAVAPVVLFHAGIQAFGGGYVGVDVFFVISGYLITGILYREALQGRFSIVNFYERRIRRIFPALFVLLAATLIVGLFVLLPDELVALGRQTAATTLFSSNLLFWSETSYFDADSLGKPLLHTWSLAVEEQFYVLFPLALWLMMRWRRWLLPAMIVVGVVSLALSIVMLGRDPSGTFYLLPTRAWELMIGGVVAVIPAYRGRFADLLSWAGVAAILATVFLYTEGMPFPGAAALPPCLGAAAILWAAQGTSCARAIANAPMRGIGLISYSLYLWHWPVIVYLGLMFGRPLPGWAVAVAIGASVLLAWASWRWVERPLRRTRDVRKVWITGAVCLVAGVVVGGGLIAAKGLPQRYPAAVLAPVRQAVADNKALEAGYACATESLNHRNKTFGPCPIGVPGGPVSVIVLGDSQGMAMKAAFSQALADLGRSGVVISMPGCPPVLGLGRVGYDTPCAERNDAIRAYVQRVKPQAVLLIAAWRGVLTSKDTVFDGAMSHDDASRLANVRGAIVRTIGAYRADGARVGFLLPAPGTPVEAARTAARGAKLEMTYSAAEQQRDFAGLRGVLDAAKPDVTGDLSTAVCTDRCAAFDSDGTPLYFDTAHPNAAGNRRFEPVIADTLKRLVATPK